MKAVVWHGLGDIRRDDVPEPQLREPADAILRLTTSQPVTTSQPAA